MERILAGLPGERVPGRLELLVPGGPDLELLELLVPVGLDLGLSQLGNFGLRYRWQRTPVRRNFCTEYLDISKKKVMNKLNKNRK